MCDCLRSAAVFVDRFSANRFPKLGRAQCSWSIKPIFLAPELLIGYKECLILQKISNTKCARVFRHDKCFTYRRVLTKLGVFGSHGFDLGSELSLKERGDEHFELNLQSSVENLEEATDNTGTLDSLKRENHENDECGVLDFDEPLEEESKGKVLKAEDLTSTVDNGENGNFEYEEVQADELSRSKPKPKHMGKGKIVSRISQQLMKRSSIVAKQVIGIESACTLGFVSQLWVDTSTWAVLEVEVRPNLLSSESGRFLLEDINKVGDVVLVQEENYILNEFRTVGLETLVGYSVVTSGGMNLGKVRGYTFNINSGTVDSLELDAFGYSIIPSSLVSTYVLFTEDVLEVVSDVIIVHDAAASRIQRLTKGLLGTKNTQTSRSINDKYVDVEEKTPPPVKKRKLKRKTSRRKVCPGTTDLGNDFELPMDYM